MLPPPEGANPHQSHCGVVAIAVITGLPLQEVFAFMRLNGKHRANWRGRTRLPERLAALRHYKIQYEGKHYHRTWLPVFETWAEWDTQRGVRYIIDTTGHTQVFKDGYVTDQRGCFPMANYWGRRKRVRNVVKIID